MEAVLTNSLHGLLAAIQVTAEDLIVVLLLQAHAKLMGLLEALVRQLSALLPLDYLLKVREGFSVANDPQIDRDHVLLHLTRHLSDLLAKLSTLHL